MADPTFAPIPLSLGPSVFSAETIAKKMTKPIHFILYDNRSGSTLLAALLNRYQGVAVTQECDYVFRVLEWRRPLRSLDDVGCLLETLATNSRFPELAIEPRRVIARLDEHGLNKGGVIRAITEEYFENHDSDADVYIIKGPRIYTHMRRLALAFPDTKFIHIIRDGRAVFHSKKRSFSSSGRVMDDNLVHAAAVWRHKLRLAQALPDRTIHIRYEDLIRESDPTLARVLDCLRVPGNARNLTKTQEAYAERIGEQHQHLHRNIASEPEEKRIRSWLNGLQPSEIYLYEYLALNELRDHGYDIHMCKSATRLRIQIEAAAMYGNAFLRLQFRRGLLLGSRIWRREVLDDLTRRLGLLHGSSYRIRI